MNNILKRSAQLSLLIGLIALIAMLLQGPGYKAGWWGLGTAFFTVFPKVVIAGGIAILLGTIGFLGPKFIGEKSHLIGILGIVFGLSAAIVPISIKQTAGSLPLIHDISTDTQNPPKFVAIAPLRADAPNPLSYNPEETSLQLQAYPDVKTVEISATKEEVFKRSLAVVNLLGWELVANDLEAGLIEATDTTLWFGFKDDVVIRITAAGPKTLVDVRSKSRIGKSDLGVNAKRIRAFTSALQK